MYIYNIFNCKLKKIKGVLGLWGPPILRVADHSIYGVVIINALSYWLYPRSTCLAAHRIKLERESHGSILSVHLLFVNMN